jgi:hypothetical protein
MYDREDLRDVLTFFALFIGGNLLAGLILTYFETFKPEIFEFLGLIK